MQLQSDVHFLDMHVHQTSAYGRLLDFEYSKGGVRSDVLAAVKTKIPVFWFVSCVSLQESTNM
jgi:hypothetical protein